MIRIIFIFTLAIFISGECKGLDYSNGYVITLNHDTIYGEIANTNFYLHSINCKFRENSKTTNITYVPNQLIGYRLNSGKYYVSKTVLVDSIPTTFFMEYLINGKLKFFFRQAKGLINHYYAENDTSGVRELIYINEIVHTKEDGIIKVEKKKYVGLLTVLTSDCSSIQSDIININEPDHKKLIKFAKKYHDLICPKNVCIIYEKKMPLKIKIEALTVSNFSVLSSNNTFQSHGLNILFSNTKISERAYIGLGVLYNPEFGINSDSFISSPFRIPLSINYLDPKNGFSPLFTIAFDLNTFGVFQSYNAGIKYQIKKVSLNLSGQMSTALFIEPYAVGLRLGLMYEL